MSYNRAKSDSLGLVSEDWTREVLDHQGQPTGSTSVRSSDTSILVRELKGQDIPDYNRRKNEGQILPYTWYLTDEQIGQVTKGEYEVWEAGSIFGTGSRSAAGDTFAHLPDWYITSQEVDDAFEQSGLSPEAFVTSAASRVYSRGHDSLTFLLELKKTVRMFRGALDRLATNLRNFRPEQIWLEARYGWRPLYFDMVEISEALSNLESERSRFTERAGTSTRFVNEGTKTINGSTGTRVYSYTDTCKVEVRGMITVDVEPPTFTFNPVVTAWELLRFSFIIDWFVSVGSYLESLSLEHLATAYSAGYGYRVTVDRVYTDCVFTPSGTIQGDFRFEAYDSWVRKHRRPTKLPIIPSINVRLDEFKVLDLLSLVLQSMRR